MSRSPALPPLHARCVRPPTPAPARSISLSIRVRWCSIEDMEKRYIVNLTKDERAGLEAMTSRGRISVLKLQRARILLKADDGLTDVEIAEELEVGLST